MDKQKIDLGIKVAVIIGICVIAYFLIVLPYLNRGEGDPLFVFHEVSINETLNSSVIHLQDKDFMSVQGLDVRQENGKIAGIIFRYSRTTPEISPQQFGTLYGSRWDADPSSRKYLEYKGSYYYAVYQIP